MFRFKDVTPSSFTRERGERRLRTVSSQVGIVSPSSPDVRPIHIFPFDRFLQFCFKNVQPSTFTRIGDDRCLTMTSFQDGIASHSGGQDCVHDLGKFFINEDWIYIKR